MFSDIAQDNDDDSGFFRLSDGFEKEIFPPDEPLDEADGSFFPSAVNVEFDIEERPLESSQHN